MRSNVFDSLLSLFTKASGLYLSSFILLTVQRTARHWAPMHHHGLWACHHTDSKSRGIFPDQLGDTQYSPQHHHDDHCSVETGQAIGEIFQDVLLDLAPQASSPSLCLARTADDRLPLQAGHGERALSQPVAWSLLPRAQSTGLVGS